MSLKDEIRDMGMDPPAGDWDEYLNERTEDVGSRKLNLSEVDNIEFDQIDHDDAPDFSDAYIVSADMNGEPMSDTELDELNECRDFVHQKLMDYLY